MPYRSSKFIDVLTGALSMAGIATDDDAARLQALGFLNTRVREGVEHDFWPELCPAEERTYRDAWASGATYAAADEVYFVHSVAGAGYYAANSAPNSPTAGQSPGSHPLKWAALTSFRRYVALAQPAQTAFGEIAGLYRRDPGLSPLTAGRVKFAVTADGIAPLNYAGATVWVRFRIRPPVFTLTEYNGATAYVAGDIRYYATTGECYKALVATTGNLPTSTAHWEKILFPYILETFVKRAVFADLLPADGENNKAGAELGKAYNALTQAHDTAFEGQGQYTTAAVETY